MKRAVSDQTVLMKSRIFLLLVAFHVLVGSLIGQTSPPASPPAAAQDAREKTSVPPDGKAQAPASPAAGTPASSTPTPAASAPTTSTPAERTPAGQAAAQPENPAKSDSDESVETIRHVVNEVRVVFTVTDRHGRYIKDLKSNDFRVIDDQKPTELRSFRSETDLPLQVGLLVDASNSVRDRFKFEQDSAIEFLNQIVRPKFDRAFVIGFDTTPEVTADFTDDAEQLSHGVRMLRPGGGTALYDAVYYACRDKLMKSGAPGGSVRKAIVLLSDGDDNQSRVTREEAIAMAQRAEVIIYTISTNSSGYKEKGDKVLERMSEATGGRAFFPFKAEDVASAFSEIQDELRSQYVIAYKPLKFVADGHYHSIEILVANRKNLTARARQGYFAPKP